MRDFEKDLMQAALLVCLATFLVLLNSCGNAGEADEPEVRAECVEVLPTTEPTTGTLQLPEDCEETAETPSNILGIY